ncbi:hypothetical protein WR25_21618 [Diploscapter pachys]|uniref:ShKT domain-containing protein n=1 Tax=Diploscapter pachys TaxID=2018661 RepID=A0A2A2LY31_9BILA|nr:hypothetical protein WR25_21618 [Diploscapter pachys]
MPRPLSCYGLERGKGISQTQKNMAILACPRYCGYCCQTCNRCDIQPPTDPAPNNGNNNNNGGIVPPPPPPPPPPVGGCTSYKPDTSPHCAKWNLNNFCASTFYTSEQKKQCTTTCKIC